MIIGFAMAESATMKRVLQPWISGLYATPTIALAPLFILWLGIGIWSKVLVVIFLVLFPVTINTEAGLRTTSERLVEMLRSFGASPRQIFFKVSLPSAVPFILAGLKLGIGRGLIGVVGAPRGFQGHAHRSHRGAATRVRKRNEGQSGTALDDGALKEFQ